MDVILRRVGNGAVLLDLKSGEVFELNATATRVWELAAEGLSTTDITTRVQDEFEGNGDDVRSDVEQLLETLRMKRLLR